MNVDLEWDDAALLVALLDSACRKAGGPERAKRRIIKSLILAMRSYSGQSTDGKATQTKEIASSVDA